MSQVTLLLEEFSTPTPSFRAGVQLPQTATSGEVVRFVMRGDVDYGPGQSIDSLIASMAERDETLVEDMQASRRRRADRAATEGVKSLKSLRLSRGLSQADLASAVGMQQPHIARIEKGNNCPTLQTCRRLAMALGVDMNTLNEHMPQVSDSVEVAS